MSISLFGAHGGRATRVNAVRGGRALGRLRSRAAREKHQADGGEEEMGFGRHHLSRTNPKERKLADP